MLFSQMQVEKLVEKTKYFSFGKKSGQEKSVGYGGPDDLDLT